MADHVSAVKRHRQSLKRKARNDLVETTLRSQIKDLRSAIAAKDAKKAKASLQVTMKLMAKAAGTGKIPKNRASRQISRFSIQVASLG